VFNPLLVMLCFLTGTVVSGVVKGVVVSTNKFAVVYSWAAVELLNVLKRQVKQVGEKITLFQPLGKELCCVWQPKLHTINEAVEKGVRVFTRIPV